LDAIKYAQDNKLEIFVLAGGSNILINDEGFDGLVIIPKMDRFEIKGNEVMAEAGVKLVDLIDECLKRNCLA